MTGRRPNLATIVGSGLAAVAAGSLLAFSSLAEQAGLQGLATGHIQPAAPASGGSTRAIRLPAPAPAPGEPADPIEQLVRDTIARATLPVVAPAPARVTPGAPAGDARAHPERPRKKDKPRRAAPARPAAAVAFAPREAPADTETPDGPPYGNAYGHHKKPKKPIPAKRAGKKHRPSSKAESGPMYARAADGDAGEAKDEAPQWKPVKDKKAKKTTRGPRNGNGHAKHAHDNGKGRGNGKGHSKHGH